MINTNALPLNFHRNLATAGMEMFRASKRLSSGLRIHSADDDPVMLSITEKMRAQIRGLDQAFRNAQDAISLLQTAEGGVLGIHKLILRMRMLVLLASNDITVTKGEYVTHADRLKIQNEIDQLIKEIDMISRSVRFNTMSLLDGRRSGSNTIGASISNLAQSYRAKLVASLYRTQATQKNEQISSTRGIQSIQPTAQPTPVTPAVNINNLTDNYERRDDDNSLLLRFYDGVLTIYRDGAFEIYGNGQTSNRIVVNENVNATIVLDNVDIETDSGAALYMRNANVNLWLTGSNTMATDRAGSAGIQTTGGTLRIYGTGALDARSTNAGGAGIGGGSTGWHGEDGGTIIINSGTITAVGAGGAGIGGGTGAIDGGSGGNITINGGLVIASSELDGAGIGGGGAHMGSGGSGGTITITGGTVIAESGTQQTSGSGAGIGGGRGGGGGIITISGGEVEAIGGANGAGIGGGVGGSGGTITVEDGIVEATGGVGAASVGGGYGGTGATFTISGGLVEIGSGQWIGGGGLPSLVNPGTTNVQGGNLSINSPQYSIHGGALHSGTEAFRVQITLQDADGNNVAFGAHTRVTYTIGTLTINAITDSQGNLFMYLPVEFAGEDGSMNFNNQTFRNADELEMDSNHNNTFVLVLQDEENNNDPTDPNRRGFHFQVGPNTGNSMFVYINAMDARTIGFVDENYNSLIDVSQVSGVDLAAAMSIIEGALSHVRLERTNLESIVNRLEYTMENLTVANESLAETESRILDTDMASEIMNLTRAKILKEAAVTLLEQANQASDMVLHLLQSPESRNDDDDDSDSDRNHRSFARTQDKRNTHTHEIINIRRTFMQQNSEE